MTDIDITLESSDPVAELRRLIDGVLPIVEAEVQQTKLAPATFVVVVAVTSDPVALEVIEADGARDERTHVQALVRAMPSALVADVLERHSAELAADVRSPLARNRVRIVGIGWGRVSLTSVEFARRTMAGVGLA